MVATTLLLAACDPAARDLASATAPAEAPAPAVIAFSAAGGESPLPEIWLVNADGSDRRQLTESPLPGSGAFPWEWSPDGSRIAYAVAIPHVMEFGVVDVDGSDQRSLGSGFAPSWSPDGERLVFDRLVGDPPMSAIHVIDLSGGERRRLIDGTGATWSPDGEEIVFTSGHGADSPSITSANADGSDRRVLARGVAPRWSPDGMQIAYSTLDQCVECSEIRIVERDGSGDRRLAAGYFPIWSPDGARLTFLRGPRDAAELVVARADGTGEVVLLRSVSLGISWSPDGTRVAATVVMAATPSPSGGAVLPSGSVLPSVLPTALSTQVHGAAVDGSRDTVVAEGSFPVWRPAAADR